jgi:hypothetical protein
VSRRSSWIAVLLVLALAGCGLRGDDQEAAQHLAESLHAEYAGLTSDQAQCVSEHWVKEIGLASLKKAGLVGDSNTVVGDVRDAKLEESDARKAAAGFAECTDVAALAAVMVTTLFKADEEQTSCIRAAVTSDAAQAWITSDLQDKVTDNIYLVGGRGCMSTAEQNAKAVASIATSLGKAVGMTKAQGRCVAEGLVDSIGTYELTAAGVLDVKQDLTGALKGTPLNATDAEIAADVIAGCVSIEEMLGQSMTDANPKAAAAVKACLTDAFDDATYHAYLVATLMDQGTGLDPQSTKDLANCLRLVVEEKQN